MMPVPPLLDEAAEKCGLDLPRIPGSLNERIEYFSVPYGIIRVYSGY